MAVKEIKMGAMQNAANRVTGIVRQAKYFVTHAPRNFKFWLFGRDWDFPLGPIEGKAGETQRVVITPQGSFMGQKIMATDAPLGEEKDLSTTGYRTAVQQIIVGNRPQRPAVAEGTLTLFFAQNSIGNDVVMTPSKIGQSITVYIKFIRDAKFYGTIWGKMID